MRSATLNMLSQSISFPPFSFCAWDSRHSMPQSQLAMNNGAAPITRKAKPRYVAPAPSVLIISSTNATMIAARVHRTRLLIPVLLAPFPGQRSATKVWLMENIALADAAMRNCSVSGRAIHPGRPYTLGKDKEKPYPPSVKTNRAKAHGNRRRRSRSIGKSGGTFLGESS